MTDTPAKKSTPGSDETTGHLRGEFNLWFDKTFDYRFPNGMRIATFPRGDIDRDVAMLDDEEEMRLVCNQVKAMFDRSMMVVLKQIWARFETFRDDFDNATAYARLDAMLESLGLEDPHKDDRQTPLAEVWTYIEETS